MSVRRDGRPPFRADHVGSLPVMRARPPCATRAVGCCRRGRKKRKPATLPCAPRTATTNATSTIRGRPAIALLVDIRIRRRQKARPAASTDSPVVWCARETRSCASRSVTTPRRNSRKAMTSASGSTPPTTQPSGKPGAEVDMNSIERRTRATANPEPTLEPTLDQRISQALGGNGRVAIEDLQRLCCAIENAIREGAKEVREEHERSLDPSTVDADQAAQRSASADLRCQRLARALVTLRARILQQERRERWSARFERHAAG